MVGILPGRSAMTGRLTLGYRTVRAVRDSWLLRAGETLRGHEFHYSVWHDRPDEIPPAYEIAPMTHHHASSRTAMGSQSDVMMRQNRREGAHIANLLASYVHLHFLARPELAARFVSAANPVVEV
jgi:cobyrinic acid a,c-diamide synthase